MKRPLLSMALLVQLGCLDSRQGPLDVAPRKATDRNLAAGEGDSADRPNLVERVRRSIVAVGLRTSADHEPDLAVTLGTGFIAGPDCTIVTARHVVAGEETARLVVGGRAADGTDYTALAELLWLDPRQDLALLVVPAVRDGEVRCTDLGRPAALATQAATTRLLGRPIAVVGYPNLSGFLRSSSPIPVVRLGAISAAGIRWTVTSEGQVWEDAPMLLLDMIGVPGFSGSPVVLADEQQVIGVLLGPGVTPPTAGFVWASEICAPTYERMRSAAEPRAGGG